MNTYRLVWRDQQGHLAKSKPIDCVSDSQAIDTAERQVGDFAFIEIWDDGRQVAVCDNPVDR